MRRLYVGIEDFRAPFDSVPFSGLGFVGDPRWQQAGPAPTWPAGRSYWDTGWHRSPYVRGYFQDNSLFGLGAAADASAALTALQAAVGAPRTGSWDAGTVAAIRRKQKELGLSETGSPDVTLLAALGLVDVGTNAPSDVQRYLRSGTAVGDGWRDLQTTFNQVPWWAYAGIGTIFLMLAWSNYDSWQKDKPGA